MDPLDFDTAFAALTGNEPFPWQRALYEKHFSKGDIPASCNLPTGLGKTSVIAVWLIALANHPDRMPRRLVYVVNRRTVVDQTTDEVEGYARLLAHGRAPLLPVLIELSAIMRTMSANPESNPLAISTLRGQFADNREWSADPSRPAVICGTVDMIGSRLLFSGYGIGKTRPLHAGFLGQDALLVHDEAHLEPAFQDLLLAIEKEQTRCKDFCPLKVMELTATSRAGGDAFALTPEDYTNDTVQKRIGATKRIQLHENKDKNKLAEEIGDLAVKYKDAESAPAVLVFVRKVDDVDKVTKKLPKGSFEQLTGTLRGLERDGLVKKPIFQRFLPESNRDKDVTPQPGTVYLVCTSAGEVGVNISADHLVCDLSTFESMAQRFGRVNRFGDRDDTDVHVVYPKEFDETKPPEPQMRKTLELLRSLPPAIPFLPGEAFTGSPAALGHLDPKARQEAFSPQPTILPTSDILFDAWALTSIRDKLPGRPPVEPYLHGIGGWEPPETHVAWREEVGRVTGDLLTEYPPKDLLEDYPLKPHELLRDNSARVFERLKKLKAKAETPVWLVADDDSVQPTTLGELIEVGKEEIERMTVLLPPSAGGLDANGMMDAASATANDVADAQRDKDGHLRRVRVWDKDDPRAKEMRLVCTITFAPPEDDDDAEDKSWWWYERPQGGDSEGSKSNKLPVSWAVHTKDVVENTTDIVGKLALGELADALILAAHCHDLGKKRRQFQTVLGNRDPNVWLAKSGKQGGRVKETYRHEFGSLIDTADHDGFKALKDDLKAFVLHVIATHHGRGRPHFPADEVFDPEPKGRDANQVAREVPQRFAKLQRKYGRWGLAYLESLLRAADYAASANPSAFVKEGE